MNVNQRQMIIGAVLAVALIVLALQLVDAVYVVLVLAVAALAGLVIWSRLRREGEDEDEEWESADEWGVTADDGLETIDLDDRLAGYTEADEMPGRRGLFAEDEFVDDAVVWEEEGEAAVVDYGTSLDEEYEELVEEYEDEEPVLEAAYEETYEEEAVEEYEEAAAYEEPEPATRPSSIFAAPGVINEEAVDSDEAILAASKATSLDYGEVLDREDANAETRELLSKVASLLAKYE
jgi:hypothetical protein